MSVSRVFSQVQPGLDRVVTVVRGAWPGAGRSDKRLAIEVDAQLPVLPQLAAQLHETSRQIEEAVTSVCGTFQAMAARAQASVAQAEAVAGGDADGASADGGGLLETLATARAAFDVLLDRLSSASERARGGAERVTALQEMAHRVETGIAKVDSIAMSVRLLALNAKIEVARDGDRSAGFAVVATEMERCASQSSEIAENIRDTAQELTVTLHGVASALREEADRAARDMAKSRTDIENALRDVERTHEQISARLNEARHMSRDLARDIGMAVMSLQFQDRVSQRVGHVIDALRRMHDALDAARPVLTNGTRVTADRRREEVADEVNRTHTMAEERTVLHAVPRARSEAPPEEPLPASPPASPPSSSGDVELF